MNDIKRVILFVVEGMSDKEALEPILAELVDFDIVRFEVIRGDITVTRERPYFSKNIKERIRIVVDQYLNKNRGIQKKYIDKIIFITDCDGCFIDQNYIYYSSHDNKFRYEDEGIYTNRVEDAIRRNQLKSQNLNILYSLNTKVYGLDVEVYYFSCNLDHVLHNIRNLSQDIKEDMAISFADSYEGHEDDFIDFISGNSLLLGSDYLSSWEKVKVSLNSLLRYSNFYQFFVNNKQYLKDECVKKIEKFIS